MPTVTLGSVKPGSIVVFKNGERAKVVRHDSDDFWKFTVVYRFEIRKRSIDDARRYNFQRTETVLVEES